MRSFFCFLILMFIAFAAFVVADIPNPNSYYDYDSDSDGDASASALASKYVEGNMTNYYGMGSASYSGDGVADFYVSATVSYYTVTTHGSFWGSDSWYIWLSGDFPSGDSSAGSGSCEYAIASASV